MIPEEKSDHWDAMVTFLAAQCRDRGINLDGVQIYLFAYGSPKAALKLSDDDAQYEDYNPAAELNSAVRARLKGEQ